MEENKNRALKAAEYSLSHELEEAIKMSREQIDDQVRVKNSKLNFFMLMIFYE